MNSKQEKEINIYYVHVEVSFVLPLLMLTRAGEVREPRQVKGFFQEIGVTCNSEELEEIVSAFVLKMERRENVRLKLTYIGKIDRQDLQQEILLDDEIGPSLIADDPTRDGIWYSTGKAYFF